MIYFSPKAICSEHDLPIRELRWSERCGGWYFWSRSGQVQWNHSLHAWQCQILNRRWSWNHGEFYCFTRSVDGAGVEYWHLSFIYNLVLVCKIISGSTVSWFGPPTVKTDVWYWVCIVKITFFIFAIWLTIRSTYCYLFGHPLISLHVFLSSVPNPNILYLIKIHILHRIQA